MHGTSSSQGKVSLFCELSDLLGFNEASRIVSGADVPDHSISDESASGHHRPEIFVSPETVDELATILAFCNQRELAIVPQGGMTGLAGGANPSENSMAISMSRFSGIEEIDPAALTMTVRAGTILQDIQEAAEEKGLMFPVDLGARGSCQIGGMVATNAGGLRVIRYGNMRANVLGLEAVLADGSIVTHLNRAKKDNTGYDLTQLMIGSEGTLGIITRLVLRLCPKPAETHTALCALHSFDAAIKLLHRAQSQIKVSAFEAMWPDYFNLSAKLEGGSFFAETPAVVLLIEAEESLDSFLEDAFEDEIISDALLAQSLSEAKSFWAVREGERLWQKLPDQLNFDVSVSLSEMDDFVSQARSDIIEKYPNAHVLVFGHIGDGNLHIVVHVSDITDAIANEIDQIVYGHVRTRNGSISAEHGIGLLKKHWLQYSRDQVEIETMKAIKLALDPNGILNPGKIFN